MNSQTFEEYRDAQLAKVQNPRVVDAIKSATNYGTFGISHNSKMKATARYLKEVCNGNVDSDVKELLDKIGVNVQYVYQVGAIDLLSGITCPYANVCRNHVKVTPNALVLVKGKNAKFKCYSARDEQFRVNVYAFRWNNTIWTRYHVKNGTYATEMAKIIRKERLTVVRIHAAGGMYSMEYAEQLRKLAELTPDVTYFGYTKGVNEWCLLSSASNTYMAFSIGSTEDDKGKMLPCTAEVILDDNPAVPMACTDKTDAQQAADFIAILRQVKFGLGLH